VDPDITSHIHKQPTKKWMIECPYVIEVIRAINTLSDRKSPGIDGIHPELLKKGGAELILRLTELITESWKNAEVI